MEKLKNLSKLGSHAKDAMQGFQELNKVAFAEGEISVANKELIAFAVAIAKQCPYCIEVHKQNALKNGVSEKALSEAVFVASAIGAGAAVTHGTHLF